MGEMGHLAWLVRDQITNGILPCTKKLSWLNRTGHGQYWSAIYSNSFTGTQPANKALLAPYYYRLYRCNEQDVKDLEFLNEYKQKTAYEPTLARDYSYGLAVNVAASEMYSFAGSEALDYTYTKKQSFRLLSEGGAELST
jgi:hypothetical protein